MLNDSGDFREYHQRILGSEFEEFVQAVGFRLRKAVRVNTLKTRIDFIADVFRENRIEHGLVPWHSNAFFVSDDVTSLSFEHQLGLFFIQEAGSMIPPVVLDVKPGERVLDLCAAPGAKTTQLAADLENLGVLVANEPNYKRIRALVYNIQRCGVSNCLVTKRDGCAFDNEGVLFDKVLVDAPCSGVGTVGKNRGVLKDWSSERVKRFSGLQKKLVSSAFDSLDSGGELVYSTCTTSLEENEEVVDYLLGEFDSGEVVKVKVPGVVARKGLSPGTRKCLRIYPHLNPTGSYFIAKVRKNE
ncbi:MAG: NOL1/NOP2/sun family putative RNA methylase [Methanobacteriota archaeon]